MPGSENGCVPDSYGAGVDVRLRLGMVAVEPFQPVDERLVLDPVPHGMRGAVVELMQVAVAAVRVPVVAVGQVHPELEAVRAGDVGQRALVGPAVRSSC